MGHNGEAGEGKAVAVMQVSCREKFCFSFHLPLPSLILAFRNQFKDQGKIKETIQATVLPVSLWSLESRGSRGDRSPWFQASRSTPLNCLSTIRLKAICHNG